VRFPLNTGFLRWAIETIGKQEFARQLTNDYRQICGARSQEDFAESLGLKRTAVRALWDDVIVRQQLAEREGNADFPLILRFLNLIHPSISISPAPFPWNHIAEGERVVLVVGERQVPIREVSRDVLQRVVGARDSEAASRLLEAFQCRMRLTGRVVHTASSNSPEVAARELQALQNSPDVGAIVVLGSQVVNPMGLAVARALLRNESHEDEPHAKFRWAHEPEDWLLSDRPSRKGTTKRTKWAPKEQGIVALTANGPFLYPRVPDDTIARDPRLLHKWRDVGLLLKDCRKKPFLVLCAGHGGAGTIGSAEAIWKYPHVLTRILAAEDWPKWRNRAYCVVTVQRSRPKGAASAFKIDDLQTAEPQIAWAPVSFPGCSWA